MTRFRMRERVDPASASPRRKSHDFRYSSALNVAARVSVWKIHTVLEMVKKMAVFELLEKQSPGTLSSQTTSGISFLQN
jgi:hypothetical protein